MCKTITALARKAIQAFDRILPYALGAVAVYQLFG